MCRTCHFQVGLAIIFTPQTGNGRLAFRDSCPWKPQVCWNITFSWFLSSFGSGRDSWLTISVAIFRGDEQGIASYSNRPCTEEESACVCFYMRQRITTLPLLMGYYHHDIWTVFHDHVIPTNFYMALSQYPLSSKARIMAFWELGQGLPIQNIVFFLEPKHYCALVYTKS